MKATQNMTLRNTGSVEVVGSIPSGSTTIDIKFNILREKVRLFRRLGRQHLARRLSAIWLCTTDQQSIWTKLR